MKTLLGKLAVSVEAPWGGGGGGGVEEVKGKTLVGVFSEEHG